ncbi:MAG: hypothetical protein MRY83_22700 [Flavobacteriales bacterium]|nr:hypothetical protein [Flavobacteriales bacterium]
MATEFFEHFLINLQERRAFFQEHFSLKIGLQRNDVNPEYYKNSCPVCGYLTLSERGIWEVCSICFWEDDGFDDSDADAISGPNHMSLNDYRIKYAQKLYEFLMNDSEDPDIKILQEMFIMINESIQNTKIEGLSNRIGIFCERLDNTTGQGLMNLSLV